LAVMTLIVYVIAVIVDDYCHIPIAVAVYSSARAPQSSSG
jgi:hypothetical protein